MTRICGRLRGIELSSQSDQCDLRAYSDACREDGLAEAWVYMERLSVPGIEASVLLEHKTAWAPSQKRELHGVGMAGKGQRIVLAEDLRLPMHRVMAQEDAEHAFSAFGGHVEVAF